MSQAIQIPVRRALPRDHLEAPIELRNVVLTQESVGRFRRGDAAPPQLQVTGPPCRRWAPNGRGPEAAGIIWMPSSRLARPKWVRRCRSTLAPA